MSDNASESPNPKWPSAQIRNPKSSTPEHLFAGQVVAPFGVKGAVKATIYTEFPERIGKLEGVVLAPFGSVDPDLAPTAGLDPAALRGPGSDGRQAIVPGPASATTFGVESASVHKGQLILKLSGVDSIEAAEGLRGYWVMVPIEQAKKLPRGSYYLYQLAGLDVYDTSGEYVGKIDEIITSAANDVYVVRGPGVTDLTGELLVPAIKAVVKRVDVAGGKMVIAPLAEWTWKARSAE
ncbi:MAG TPA: ribosome maturation factor RimM [Chloroflexia bacterium]|nr:ribosome maturation factor RimM [Chloroflexia bacterium]